MKYVIDEEELLDLIDQYDYNEPNIKDFLKSKTPVEEIAEGEVGQKFDGFQYRPFMENLYINAYFDRYVGKNIKIYIEVIK